ncbi:uncharacterized protein LOC124919630 [Impatiens glandulifera]|uniref:uncharacterized protein LOC124919630 n=1 Tax=Impatiens glandulifera TaxID=253017 RepID=UPI001FB09FAB|nr:uncharacterized protein LOC124919630 [Impatiens glandulifera]
MAELSKSFFVLSLGFLFAVTSDIFAESPACLTVYKEGGAPAVFQSPKCPRWKLLEYVSSPGTARCQTAMHQGRRPSQEDRTLCALDIRIPFPGPAGLSEFMIGILAVFDGHNGVEASEMASRLLLEYFMLHTYFLLDTTFSILSSKSIARLPDNSEGYHALQGMNMGEKLQNYLSDSERQSALFVESFHLEILKESLLKAIVDIDATFSKEASRDNLHSGSTATVILLADGQILVANIGDSKALLCSERFQSPAEARASLIRLYRNRRQNGVISHAKNYDGSKWKASNGFTHLFAHELTRDHHPDRHDERSRVESSGGYVLDWGGVSRVNGQLAVSRSIGDISFKSYGVISTPEVSEWKTLAANDSYLVAASDGIFDKLTPEDVCDISWDFHTRGTLVSKYSSACSSLAECIVSTAFERGSVDNLAAVVVPLRSSGFSWNSLNEYDGEEVSTLSFGMQRFIDDEPDMELAHPFSAKFDRLLVKGKQSSVGCFYLSENLSEDVDYSFWVQKVDQQVMYEPQHALCQPLIQRHDESIKVHVDQSTGLCLGTPLNGGNGKCMNPELFAGFLGFLDSIPFLNSGSEYGSAGHSLPDSRYILKKRFDRGAFGEVWLAYYWNCSEGSNVSRVYPRKQSNSFNNIHLGMHDGNFHTKFNASDSNFSNGGDNLFILKRIMVERGSNFYLSGLREKYFGEVFLNASSSLGGHLSSGQVEPLFEEPEQFLFDYEGINDTVAHQTLKCQKFQKIVRNKNNLHNVSYEEGLNHVARYVESFESQSNDIWLVFHHEGMSLSKLLYTAKEVENNGSIEHIQVLQPSKWWNWLKTTDDGQEEMRNLVWQLLMALKSCHDRNITHRDIKPENMVICFEDQETGRCMKERQTAEKKYPTKLRIIDFGSAIDEHTMKHLYGSAGPSRAEQTYDYTPPEALLNASWHQGPADNNVKYDMWSVGVVMLEMILGTPDVFQISAVSLALLDQHLEGWSEGLKELAHKLRSFMELCILVPGSSAKSYHSQGATGHTSNSPASWKCSEEYFSLKIRSRDPLGIGFPDTMALRLVRQLLVWDPEDRLSVDDALKHPYFHPLLQKTT